jgi:hypothetical protein
MTRRTKTQEAEPTKRRLATMGRALRGFGYRSLTDDQVRQEAKKLMKGEEPKNIIAMFVHDWLKQAGILPAPAAGKEGQ